MNKGKLGNAEEVARPWGLVSRVACVICLISSLLSSPLVLKRDHIPPTSEQVKALETIVKKFNRFRSHRNPDVRSFKRAKGKGMSVDTVRVLALRVEFVEDFDTLTTGNGKMDLRGFFSPESGLFYDPPHTKRYFERQLEALRNYFRHNSYGRLYIDFKVMPEGVLDCYQLPNRMSYYGDSMHKRPYFDFTGVEMGLCRLMEDAIRVADRDPNINWHDWDYYLIFHAGSCAQTDLRGNSPFDLFAATIGKEALRHYLKKDHILTDDGKRIDIAAILPEMTRQDTAHFGKYGMHGILGLLAHEFCHLLGAYDLYDVTGRSMGVGAWSLMGSGGWLGDYHAGAPPGSVPPFLDAYHRVLFGWAEPRVLNMPKENTPVFCQAMDSSLFRFRGDSLHPTVIKIPITSSEYFLIENRQCDVKRKDTIIVDREDGVLVGIEDGEYDFFLPGSGILIWHIDEEIIAQYGPYNAVNINPRHKGVDLEEADGVQDFDGWVQLNYYELYGSKYDPFFKGGFLDVLSPTTNPTSDGYRGKTFFTINTNTQPETIMTISFSSELLRKNFPKEIGAFIFSLSHADLDRDGKIELLVQDTLGDIYAYQEDGSPYLGTPFAYINSVTKAPFAVGDVTGDEKLEVIAGGERGEVIVFDAEGRNIRSFQAPGGVRSPICLFDLNLDGKKEILFGSEDMRIHCFTGAGETLFRPISLSGVMRGLVVIDSLNPKIFALTNNNVLYLISDGRVKKRELLSESPYPPPSPPVAADLNWDGRSEVIVLVPETPKHRLVVFSDAGDIRFTTRPVIEHPSFSYIALSDVDKDGYLDIITAGKNKIYAFNSLGVPLTNYPREFDSIYIRKMVVEGWIITERFPFIFKSSPVIADLEGDGISDILIGSPDYGAIGVSGKTGDFVKYFPLHTQGSVLAPPLLFDFEGDGKAEMAVADDRGMLYVYNLPFGSNITWGKALLACDNNPWYKERPTYAPIPSGKVLEEFYVYPNPCGPEGYIRLKTGRPPLKVKWKVLDITGEPVKGCGGEVSLNSTLSSEIVLSTKSLASGVYILKLEVVGEKEARFYKFGVVK